MLVDPIIVRFAAVTGFMAAAIAVGGFIAHARQAIAGASEEEIRRRTAVGGVCGLVAAATISGAGMIW